MTEQVSPFINPIYKRDKGNIDQIPKKACHINVDEEMLLFSLILLMAVLIKSIISPSFLSV